MKLIIVIFIVWLFSLLSICLGLYIGSQFTDKPVIFKFPKIIKRKSRVGAISKLTPIEAEKKGTTLEATEKAMQETLDDLL